MSTSFPQWSYFPRNSTPPTWVHDLVGTFAAQEPLIGTEAGQHNTSDQVLALLRPDLELLGYQVEKGKAHADRLRRPVLYGDGGVPEVSYEVDAYHPALRILVEVEAGRGAMGNAEYRDIVRSSLVLDADYLVLALPVVYRYAKSSTKAYQNTRGLLDAIYASDRLKLPFLGVLLVGY